MQPANAAVAETDASSASFAQASPVIADTPPAPASPPPSQPAPKNIPSAQHPIARRSFSKGNVLATVAGAVLLVLSTIWALQPGSNTAPQNQNTRPASDTNPSSGTEQVQPKTAEPTVRPTFTCPGDGFEDEKTICSNSGLATLERRMQTAYRNLARRQPNRHVPPDAHVFAQKALAERHECNAKVSCIMNVLLSETLYFQNYPAAN